MVGTTGLRKWHAALFVVVAALFAGWIQPFVAPERVSTHPVLRWLSFLFTIGGLLLIAIGGVTLWGETEGDDRAVKLFAFGATGAIVVISGWIYRRAHVAGHFSNLLLWAPCVGALALGASIVPGAYVKMIVNDQFICNGD